MPRNVPTSLHAVHAQVLLQRRVGDEPEEDRARDVREHVDRAEAVDGGAHERGPVVFVADVAVRGGGAIAELVGQCLRALVDDVGHDDRRALGDERTRRRRTDAA